MSDYELVAALRSLVNARERDRRGTIAYASLLRVAEAADRIEELGRQNRALGALVDEQFEEVPFDESTPVPAMEFYTQTLFGDFDAPPAERGDCDRTCLASFLDCEPSSIPHFYALGAEIDVHRKLHEWLEARDFFRVAYAPTAGVDAYWIPMGTFIAVGKSPRGDHLHAVIGEVTSRSPLAWRLIHDPHPSREGIVGWPVSWEFVFTLSEWNVVEGSEGSCS